MTSELLTMAQYGSELTTLPARFVAAWWAAENGYEWDTATNNPGNVSYTGEGIPSGGIFDGVTKVLENEVCVYDTATHGVEAWAQLLKAPTEAHGGTKILSVDLSDLTACRGNVHAMAAKIGASNWASGHYVDPADAAYDYPGGTIVGAYESTTMDALFAADNHDPTPATPAPVAQSDSVGSRLHYVQPGDRLSLIGLRYQVPWLVLARFNSLSDPDLITVGEPIKIPESYKIRAGDTLSALSERFGESVEFLAHVNQVEPDRIFAGAILWH